jgi:hypothetical protein
MENGGTYYVSGWVRVANAASASTKITARITDGAGTRYTQVVAGTANSTGWVRLASFFTLSYTGALNDLYLYFEGPPSGVDLLVDDFRVEPNTVPALSAIADRTIAKNTGTGAIPFTVNDAQTGTTGLIVSADSSNTALVPNANVVLGGSAGNRTVTVTPIADAAGSTTITISANDGRISGSRSFVLHVGTPLEQWRFTHFGTTTAAGVAANTADGDGDGVSNVLEFFLALNPKVASRTGLPAVAREGSDLTLSYTRSKAALTEINHEVQWSTDLQTWSTVGVTQQVLSETGTFEKVIARVPIGDAPAKFMRLGVSAP